MKKEYWIIFAIIVTEVLGFSIILPFLPFYAELYGASPFVVGLILASFSLAQFITSPIMGNLSDQYGRKPLLIISQLSTFISFVMLGLANNLWMIFASRIIDGLFGSNMAISQAYLTDISSKKDRSKVFGLTGLAFGFGFLIGPVIGGYLSQFGYAVPSFTAAAVVIVTIFMTMFILPETIKKKKKTKFDLKIINFKHFKYLKKPETTPIFLQIFTYLLAHVMWVSMFALYAERQLQFNAMHIGYVLTYIGVVSIIFRGIILQKLIDLFPEKLLQLAGSASMMLGLAGSIIVTEWIGFLIVMTFFAMGTGLMRPLLLGSLSRQVSRKEQGTILGVVNSVGSVTQIIAPLIGGFLIHNYAPSSLGFVAAGLMFLPLSVLLKENNGVLKS